MKSNFDDDFISRYSVEFKPIDTGSKEKKAYKYFGLPYPVIKDFSYSRSEIDVDKIFFRKLQKYYEFNEEAYIVGEIFPLENEELVVKLADDYIKNLKLHISTEAINGDIEFADELTKYLFLSYKKYTQKFNSLSIKNEDNWYKKDQMERSRANFVLNNENSISGYTEYLKKKDTPFKNFFFQKLKVGLPENERKKHTYILGGSGSGKSELIKLIIYSYIINFSKSSIILLDPNGDLSEQVAKLENIQTDKFFNDKLVYIDPYLSKKFIPSINPFEIPSNYKENNDYIDLSSQFLSSVFKEIIKSEFTANMETLFINCICVLLRRNNSNIKDLIRFMDDNRNMDLVNLGKKSPNSIHREFFEHDFYMKDLQPTKRSISKKIQYMLSSSILTDLLTKKTSFDLEKLMNEKKLIVFNLSKGKMGKDASNNYGRFIVSTIQSIALRRAYIPEHLRVPCHLFIDEFQNYVTPSIQEVLTESRKYGLHLTLAHQFLGQNMNTELKNAISSNTNIKIIGKNSHSGGNATMSKEINVPLDKLDNLSVGQFYVKCGSKPSFKLYTPSFLVKNQKSVSNELWKEIKDDQIRLYYTKRFEEKENDLISEIKEDHKNKSDFENNDIRKPKLNF